MADNQRYSLTGFLKYRFNLDDDKAEEQKIIDSIKKNIEFKGTNLWTLIFAILIASIGLNVNSTAVIIGAMLISPLMGPIMGIGLGAGIFDFKLIKTALKNLLIAVVISLITSTVYFLASPLHEARGELLARTSPTIWDVLIALFGGLAGIIASSRKNISNVIPGVAIATALMPPLCTAGFGLGTGNFYYFIGAFYLFIINSVFISISTFLIVRFLKFRPVQFVDQKTEHKVRKYMWVIALITIIPSAYLAYRFVGQEIFKQRTQNFIGHEVKSKGIIVMDKAIDVNARRLKLILYGEDLNDSLLKAILLSKENYELKDADIEIERTLNSNRKVAEMTDAGIPEISELQNKLIEKEKKIRDLNLQIQKQRRFAIDTAVYKEFRALYGNTKELLIVKSEISGNEGKKDTVVLVYYSLRSSRLVNKAQMEEWLKTRLEFNNVKIVTAR